MSSLRCGASRGMFISKSINQVYLHNIYEAGTYNSRLSFCSNRVHVLMVNMRNADDLLFGARENRIVLVENRLVRVLCLHRRSHSLNVLRQSPTDTL